MVEKMCLWWWVVGALAVFMEWVDGCALARVCAGGGRFCWEEDHDDEADREGFADLACIFALFNYSSRWNMCDHGTIPTFLTLLNTSFMIKDTGDPLLDLMVWPWSKRSSNSR
jgi:hypothetical protein